jgi:hypothetical protein
VALAFGDHFPWGICLSSPLLGDRVYPCNLSLVSLQGIRRSQRYLYSVTKVSLQGIRRSQIAIFLMICNCPLVQIDYVCPASQKSLIRGIASHKMHVY